MATKKNEVERLVGIRNCNTAREIKAANVFTYLEAAMTQISQAQENSQKGSDIWKRLDQAWEDLSDISDELLLYIA